MESRVFVSRSPEETEQIATRLMDECAGGAAPVFALFGDLGAGKTCFVRGLCAALGYTGECSSPTFALVHEYRQAGRLLLAHFDMYRVQGIDDLETTGYYDYLDAGCALAIEWSERIADELPRGAVRVCLTAPDEQTRRIEVIQEGERP